MVQAVSYDTAFDMVPAFAGMIADSMFTDKVSVPCGAAPVAFGVLVGADAATGRSVFPITAANVQGVAIHDHNMSGRWLPGVTGANDGYVQYDSIAVMKRGRIWGRAGGACTKDAVAKVDPATGLFSDAGALTVPGARFMSANISIIGVLGTDTPHSIVMVEMSDGTIDAAGV